MNNHIWFYKMGAGRQGHLLIGERDYLGTVEAILLNATYVVVLAEGKAQLQLIEGAEEGTFTVLLIDSHCFFRLQ